MDNKVSDIITTRKNRAQLRIVRSAFVRKVLFILSVIILLFSTLLGINTIHGNDMSPALNDGDIVLFVRQISDYSNGDVVVFNENDNVRTGRITAVNGDILKAGTDSQIVFNDRVHPVSKESGAFYKTVAGNKIDYPVRIGKDEYFILGDKRDTAADSRSFGKIRKCQIKGKVFLLIRKRCI